MIQLNQWAYMTPEQAARGLELFENIKDDNHTVSERVKI